MDKNYINIYIYILDQYVNLKFFLNEEIFFPLDTSRPPRQGEINGKEYHFVTREKIEEDIQAGKFIEYGEYKGNLYGTSSDGVISLVNAGYVCLLNPHYQALKMLRTQQLRPYIVYVKPPSFEVLKETRSEARARSTFDESNSRGFTV